MSIMNTNVLVLNRNYTPIWITNLKRAFTLLCNSMAEVVSVADGTYYVYDINSWAEISELKRELNEITGKEDWVYSARSVFEAPRVIKLTNYDKIPTTKVKLTRKNIFSRDNNTCMYCGHKFSTVDLNIDHVVPSSEGGKNEWTNLVCSCYKCNSKKANKSLKEARMKLIREPHEPKFIPPVSFKNPDARYDSWKNFLSDVYWNVIIKE